MSYIRIKETPKIMEVLDFLQSNEYSTLNKAEIIKVALAKEASRIYSSNQVGYKKYSLSKKQVLEAKGKLQKAGRQLGKDFLQKRNLDRKKLSEQDLYDLIKNT